MNNKKKKRIVVFKAKELFLFMGLWGIGIFLCVCAFFSETITRDGLIFIGALGGFIASLSMPIKIVRFVNDE